MEFNAIIYDINIKYDNMNNECLKIAYFPTKPG